MVKSYIDDYRERQTELAFKLFIVYLVSFFLHLPARITLLGVIRFDMLLVAAICYLVMFGRSSNSSKLDDASKCIIGILLFSILSLPLTEWPGSVINNGIVAFIKGAIFYFFAVTLVVNERRLRITIFFFVSLNMIRVLEPLFLNVTQGYLGSVTHLGYGQFAGRLSGAPSDTVNPNGLAFIIATIIPFLHYVFFPINKKSRAIYFALIPLLIYTMLLTLSRSGILALGLIAIGIFIKSTHKSMLILVGIIGLSVVYFNMSDIQKDRYLSIISSDAKQSASAEGRIDGWISDFGVAMNKPIIGHGLGTSREANWNVAGKDQVSHILWAEIWQEIGLIGLVIFVLYLKVMVKNFRDAGRLIRSNLGPDTYLYRVTQAMQVWLLMNLLFSFASYGLKSYEWYFFGGLSVALMNITNSILPSIRGGFSESEGPKGVGSIKYSLARKVR